jgi:hypothetical protein
VALPVQISTVVVTATLVDDAGNPLQGVVTLTPSLSQIVSASTDRIIELAPRIIQLDEYGGLSTKMIPSDEADVAPHGVTWAMTLPGDSAPAFSFYVPSDVTEADISQYVITTSVREEPAYLIGYRGPKGDKGDPGPAGPAGYDDTALQGRVSALESAGFVRRLVYGATTPSQYPIRPVGVPAGYCEYVGPTEPTDWLTGDTWVEQV